MSESPVPGAVLTLEPFLEAVRQGLEEVGWGLSGLQKTTSYEFEGRWAGDSSRSAYLFFHRSGLPDWISIDAFLDETSRGLKGNLALVVDGPPLSDLSDPGAALASLSRLVKGHLPMGYRTPLTLRYRLPDPDSDPGDADTEVRFKVYFPPSAMKAGSSAVAALAGATAEAYREILEGSELRELFPLED